MGTCEKETNGSSVHADLGQDERVFLIRSRVSLLSIQEASYSHEI